MRKQKAGTLVNTRLYGVRQKKTVLSARPYGESLGTVAMLVPDDKSKQSSKRRFFSYELSWLSEKT